MSYGTEPEISLTRLVSQGNVANMSRFLEKPIQLRLYSPLVNRPRYEADNSSHSNAGINARRWWCAQDSVTGPLFDDAIKTSYCKPVASKDNDRK